MPHNGVRYLGADNTTAPGYGTTVPFNFTHTPSTSAEALPLVVVLGETGVGGGWYSGLATALAAQGYVVVYMWWCTHWDGLGLWWRLAA